MPRYEPTYITAYKRCFMLPIYISDSFSAVATDIIGSVSERCRRISHDMAREGIWKEYSTLAKSLPLESGGLHQFVPGKSTGDADAKVTLPTTCHCQCQSQKYHQPCDTKSTCRALTTHLLGLHCCLPVRITF